MFKRREKRAFLPQLREFVWPHMGWKRFGHYLHLRLIRLKATPYQIATGLSFGVSISFVPLPGTHIITAALLTMLFRGNVLASLLGTLSGNPWTFPLMWWGAYHFGRYVFGIFDLPVAAMPDTFEWHDLVREVEAHPFELMVPWVAGGILLGAIFWPIVYSVFYRLVVRSRKRHAEQKYERVAR